MVFKSVDLTYSLAHGTYVVCLVYAPVSNLVCVAAIPTFYPYWHGRN